MNDFNGADLKLYNEYHPFPHLRFAITSLLLILLIYIIGSMLVELMIDKLAVPDYKHYIDGFSQIIFMLLPTYLFAKKSSLPLNEIFRLKAKLNYKILILSIIGLFVFQFFTTSYLFLQEAMMPKFLLHYYQMLESFIQKAYTSVLGGESIFDAFRALAIGALIPAICEESLFRGLFQRSLEEMLNPIQAILISGLIFGIIHMNPIDIVPLILVGLYLGILAYSSGSLLLPIIIHFINNAFAIAVFYIPTMSSLNDTSSDMTISLALPMCVISFAIFIYISIFIYRIGIDKKIIIIPYKM